MIYYCCCGCCYYYYYYCVHSFFVIHQISIFMECHQNSTIFRSKLSSGQTCHEVIVLGRRYTAAEALNAGIVHEISAPVELMSKALSWITNNLPKYGYDRKHLQTIKEDIYNDEFQTLMAKL